MKILKKMLNSAERLGFSKIVPIPKVIDKLLGKSTGLAVIVTGIKK